MSDASDLPWARLTRRTFTVLLLANLGMRFLLGLVPGYAVDTAYYKRWALTVAREGVTEAYTRTDVDYPPLFLYLLWCAGKAYLSVYPDARPEALPASPLLNLLVKLPHQVFDFMLAGLIYFLVVRFRLWDRGESGPEASLCCGRLAALAYLWNPAVLFGSAYWGQPDGIHSFLCVASLASLAAGRLFASGLLLSAAVLMKPLAAPLVPLLLVVGVSRAGLAGLVRVALGGVAGLLVTFLPYLLAGNWVAVIRTTLTSLDVMPFTSVNAHNLWWLIGGWRPAGQPVLGPLTPKMIGLASFGLVFAWLAVARRDWMRHPPADPSEDRARLFLHAAALVTAFFFLATHMHENHMFLAVPLLLLVLGRSRSLTRLALGCSLAVFANELLHDPDLPHLLPGVLGALSPVLDPHAKRPLTWLQVGGSFLNTLLVGYITLRTFRETARRP